MRCGKSTGAIAPKSEPGCTSFGAHPDDLPELPPRGEATALVVSMPECRHVELMGKAEREHTPPAFAAWLVELARRTSVERLAA